ncbi:MAG: hypothetical protein WBF34_22755, partial [Streptosporangiaceae bacterium]
AVALNLCRLDAYWNDTPLNRGRTSHLARLSLATSRTELTTNINGGPKCRHDHRLKQHPRWNVDQLPDGTFQWTTPSGRQYLTEPTRYPI